VTIAFKAEGEHVLLVGDNGNRLGQSLYLRELFGREEGAPPAVDLATERRNGDFLRGLIQSGRVTACHDISDGGLAVALAEMAIAGERGARIRLGGDPAQAHGWLFSEEQSRYLLTCAPRDASAIRAEAADAGVTLVAIGHIEGSDVDVQGFFRLSVAELRRVHEAWLPAYMSAPP
jgi:phosphoribosylformylglycinamidine synthase